MPYPGGESRPGTTVTTGGLIMRACARTLATASRVSSTATPRPTITQQAREREPDAQLGLQSARADALLLEVDSPLVAVPPSSAASNPTTASSTDSEVAAISVLRHPARHRRVPELAVDVDAERGIKLAERSAPQRGAQPREVPGSDPQLVRPALTGELRVQGRRQRRLVGDDEAGRVGGKRREAAEDPDHARDHREAVDRQGDPPAGPGGGGSLRIGEHRTGACRLAAPGRSTPGVPLALEADHRDGTARTGAVVAAAPTRARHRAARAAAIPAA
jgi:hypothetical protein